MPSRPCYSCKLAMVGVKNPSSSPLSYGGSSGSKKKKWRVVDVEGGGCMKNNEPARPRWCEDLIWVQNSITLVLVDASGG